MRDDHRMREKLQLQLEHRHVAVIGVSALVLLGAVFALGVNVGKQLASAAPQPAPIGDLAALDREREVAAATPVAPPAPAEKPAPREPPKEAPAAPPPAPAQAEAPSADEKPAEAKPADVKPAVALVVPAEEKPKAVLAIPSADKITVRAAPSAAAAPLPPPPSELGAFTVQLGASQDRSDALRLEGKARSAGLKPYVLQVDLGAKGLWYRVRVGAFKTREDADRYRRDVERELRVAGAVMPTR